MTIGLSWAASVAPHRVQIIGLYCRFKLVQFGKYGCWVRFGKRGEAHSPCRDYPAHKRSSLALIELAIGASFQFRTCVDYGLNLVN